jgi:hypothetical protein
MITSAFCINATAFPGRVRTRLEEREKSLWDSYTQSYTGCQGLLDSVIVVVT